jgi:hypothetical protein
MSLKNHRLLPSIKRIWKGNRKEIKGGNKERRSTRENRTTWKNKDEKIGKGMIDLHTNKQPYKIYSVMAGW